MNRAEKARQTLKLLEDEVYNFTCRPNKLIEQDFGEALVMLHRTLKSLQRQVNALSKEIHEIPGNDRLK